MSLARFSPDGTKVFMLKHNLGLEKHYVLIFYGRMIGSSLNFTRGFYFVALLLVFLFSFQTDFNRGNKSKIED